MGLIAEPDRERAGIISVACGPATEGRFPARSHRIVGTAQAVGWDKWCFAAPAHQDFSTFPDGGPALEASWSHPTMKKALALILWAEREESNDSARRSRCGLVSLRHPENERSVSLGRFLVWPRLWRRLSVRKRHPTNH